MSAYFLIFCSFFACSLLRLSMCSSGTSRSCVPLCSVFTQVCIDVRPHIVQRKHFAVRNHGHVSDHTYLCLQSKSCQSSVVSRRLLRFCNGSTRTEETYQSSGGSSMTSHARGKTEPNDICSTGCSFRPGKKCL